MGSRAEHPDRPKKPARPYPLTGDDNSDWHAWWNACDTCKHSSERHGCERGGVVTYAGGRTRGLPRIRGGCAGWEPLNG